MKEKQNSVNEVEQDIHKQVQLALEGLAHPEKELAHQKFYKAFPGGYGGEDRFLCVSTPEQHKIAKVWYQLISLDELSELLKSNIHEYRLCALMMLVLKYQKAKDPIYKKSVCDFYLSHLDFVNNWDLVDSSAHYILGDYLLDKDDRILISLAKTNHLWRNRVAMISCFAFIRKNRFETALEIAGILLNHEHDLIHKAVGWMLREIGKRDLKTETYFLEQFTLTMPRTMLRYAIEKFPEDLRLHYLRLK